MDLEKLGKQSKQVFIQLFEHRNISQLGITDIINSRSWKVGEGYKARIRASNQREIFALSKMFTNKTLPDVQVTEQMLFAPKQSMQLSVYDESKVNDEGEFVTTDINNISLIVFSNLFDDGYLVATQYKLSGDGSAIARWVLMHVFEKHPEPTSFTDLFANSILK